MDSGPTISLSPNEETTLFRVARGITDVETTRAQEIDRLILLRLVTLTASGCRLTALGEQRTRRLGQQSHALR
jgi:hypothetical protein